MARKPLEAAAKATVVPSESVSPRRSGWPPGDATMSRGVWSLLCTMPPPKTQNPMFQIGHHAAGCMMPTFARLELESHTLGEPPDTRIGLERRPPGPALVVGRHGHLRAIGRPDGPGDAPGGHQGTHETVGRDELDGSRAVAGNHAPCRTGKGREHVAVRTPAHGLDVGQSSDLVRAAAVGASHPQGARGPRFWIRGRLQEG